MQNVKKYNVLIALLLSVLTASAVDYVDLDAYKDQQCIKSPSGTIASWLEDGWNSLVSSVNETVYTDNISTDRFWNTLHSSLEDGTFYNRVAGMQFADLETGSDLFLKTVYSAIYEIPVKYKSSLPNGDTITLSGKIFLPKNKRVKNIIIANHYTICSNQEAPGHASCIEGIFATKDYIVLMPDYIGYGISQSITHPYLHLESTVTSAIDLLKAALPYLQSNCYIFSKSLILIGYSQGAAATLALQNELEKNYSNAYSIQQIYAGAGPYDLAATFDFYTSNPFTDIPCSLPMLIMGMNMGEDLHLRMEDFFQPILLKAYPRLIESKTKMMNEVNAELGNDIKKLLKPVIFHKDSYPTSVLYKAVQNNCIVQWTPQNPLYLFHSTEDNMVPFLNSLHVKEAFDSQQLENVQYDFAPYGNHMNAAVTFFEKVYKSL